MKSSVVFPYNEIGNDTYMLTDFIQSVEEMGYDCLNIPVLDLGAASNPFGSILEGFSIQPPRQEIFKLIDFLADLPTSLEIAAGILNLPQHPTVLVAEQTAEIDVMLNGRLRIGAGFAETDPEIQTQGYDFIYRGNQMEEQISLLRELWVNPLVTYHGKYHAVDEIGIGPMPVQRPIPIWLVGDAEDDIRRVANLGDGWLFRRPFPDESKSQFEILHNCLEDAGRSLDGFGIDVRVNLSNHHCRSWPELVEGWQSLGVTYIGVNTIGSEYKSMNERIDAIRMFKDETGL